MTDAGGNVAEQAVQVPVFQEYFDPILVALKALGGEATIEELDKAVAKHMRMDEAVLSVLHNSGPKTEVFYRMAWSRTYLKKAGLLDNPRRGVWALTQRGRETGRVDGYELARQVQQGVDAQSVEAELPPHMVEELLAVHDQLLADGTVYNEEDLQRYYRTFRLKFGPEVLERLDGELLLTTIHARGTKDSLVYWLEFKDDTEFRAVFGSIAGGSALKFGIFQSTDTGNWMTGHPQSQKRLTVAEAIDAVEEQKRQLLAGGAVLEDFRRAADFSRNAYVSLELSMAQAAPELANTAWGHKYFSLLFPDVLDDYHAIDYQRFHLMKILKIPSEGRYENAWYFTTAARQLGLPVSAFATTLNHRNGGPHAYWRIATMLGDSGQSEWPQMRDGGFAAVGWKELGDLSGVERSKPGKDHVRALMEAHFPATKSEVTRRSQELFKFVTWARPGDVVLAMDGATVRGLGVISGDYSYVDAEGALAHRRPVDWLSTDEWKLPVNEGLRTTFHNLGKQPANIVEAERFLARPSGTQPPKQPIAARLSGVLGRIEAVLRRKRQVILFGPPGTGKTYQARKAVQELTARSWFGSGFESLSQTQRDQLEQARAVETCCFHPSYGYEDFLEGYRPATTKGALSFERRDGIFKRVCERAAADPEHQYFLLIDEINRGDVPRIFGELLTVLEKDKRGVAVTLPLSGTQFTVPENVYIVATMNTADRSVSLLDAALRRRFGFIELMPDSGLLRQSNVGGLPLGAWLTELNRRVVAHAGRDARNLQVGHSYLMRDEQPIQDVARFVEVLRDDVIPLLQEYCYENFSALEQILGSSIVLREQQRIDESLFQQHRQEDLLQALLAAFDGIVATAAAVAAEGEVEQDADDTDDDPAAEETVE